MYACMYVRMHVCMHACMHVITHICIHVCMHACMHACTYMNNPLQSKVLCDATVYDRIVGEIMFLMFIDYNLYIFVYYCIFYIYIILIIIIKRYYAMIAEYDDMVGEMVAAVQAAGVMDDTVGYI